MEVKINLEIRNYKEAIFFELSLRQFIFSVCACAMAVGLSILGNEHIKVLHQLTTFPAFRLVDSVNAVRHILCLTEAIFITDNTITLIGIGICISACGFQVNFKFCSFFGCFNMGFPSSVCLIRALLPLITCSITSFKVRDYALRYKAAALRRYGERLDTGSLSFVFFIANLLYIRKSCMTFFMKKL